MVTVAVIQKMWDHLCPISFPYNADKETDVFRKKCSIKFHMSWLAISGIFLWGTHNNYILIIYLCERQKKFSSSSVNTCYIGVGTERLINSNTKAEYQ
jgi:hypothetical protein